MAEPEIVLDISRLMSRVMYSTPTGVDRVEMAYARGLLELIPDRLAFSAFRPRGTYARLDTASVRAFLEMIEAQWDGTVSPPATRIAAIQRLIRVKSRKVPARRDGRNRIYLQVSPHHLDRPEIVERILRQEQAQFACMVHDLIPIEYPEYARPGGAEQHARRMATIGRFAALAIANSHATADALAAHLEPSGRIPATIVAHLGTHLPQHSPNNPVHPPYFVYVSTIEPRKNHLLLLHVWREMAKQASSTDPLPKLILVGRRGWENENVVDLLERCPDLREHVIEADRLSDDDVEDLVRNATAVLFPSFAEGYGMPVAEALQMGVPVIASDLPVLREVGGSVPDYLHPLDGPGWLTAIQGYARPSSERRLAQLKRLQHWKATTWDTHLARVLQSCESELAAPAC